MQEVVKFGTILAGEERISVIGVGRDVKIGAINGKQTETFEKDRRLCLFHEQMKEKGKSFREKPPPPFHKSGDRNHIGGTTNVTALLFSCVKLKIKVCKGGYPSRIAALFVTLSDGKAPSDNLGISF